MAFTGGGGRAEDPKVSRGGRVFLIIWAVAVLAAYAASAYFLSSAVYRHKINAADRSLARISAPAVEPGADIRRAGREGVNATVVRTGLYLDRTAECSVRESYWVPEFYIWFRWRGDDVNPGETFDIVDGEFTVREKVDDLVVNGEHYQIYHCIARITKFFDMTRFPRDDQLLTITVEDSKWESSRLRYVPDAAGSRLSARVLFPGYRVYRYATVVRNHYYPTTYGDPRLPARKTTSYSQFIFGTWVARRGWGVFYKVFIGLFVAVSVSLMGFWVRPTDGPRFGLGIGALFAAVAHNYIATAIMPDMSVMTLTDMIDSAGIVTIFLTLLASTVSLYLYDRRDEETLSRLFDRVSLAVFVVGYAGLNVALPLAASL